MFLLTFVSFLIKNALLTWFFMNKGKKMKKRLFLLLILSVLFLKSGIAQVAKIKNEFISKNDIILIGPLNVDAYFPEQSNIYISKYERIIDELNSLINDFESELAYLDHKRIKNKFEINQIYKVIEKFNFELELLNEFLSLGYFNGWFPLEQLCYDKDAVIKFYEKENVTEEFSMPSGDFYYVKGLREKLGFNHILLNWNRLIELENLYFDKLAFEDEYLGNVDLRKKKILE